jgi:enolase
LAFASGADFIKTGVYGKEREIKLNRLISIEKEIRG